VKKYLITYKNNKQSDDAAIYSFYAFAENPNDALLKFFEKYGRKWRIIDTFIVDCKGMYSSVYDDENNCLADESITHPKGCGLEP
jgi:hypothetical protein